MNRPTVLLVDDERSVVEGWTDLLRRPYHILTANSGLEALAILETEEVHVIVTDEQMPG